MSLFHFIDIGLNLPLEQVGHFLAQVVPAPGGPIAPIPGPGPAAGDSAFGIESTIIKVISEAAFKLANNDFFKAFNGLMLIVGAWLFVYRLLITGFLGYFTEGQGVLRKMIVSTVGGIIILMFALHPEIMTEVIQGAFFMLRRAADEILLNPAQGYDLESQINAVADAFTAAINFDPAGIVHGLVWLAIVASVIVFVALYYVHLIEALIYILMVVPFLARAAFVGLLSQYTSGWFWAVVNAGLKQLLKPVLSRIIIFLVLSVMAGVAENVKANAATLPVLSQLQGSFGAVFGFLVVLVIGLVMMFKVPTIADVLAVSASGAARDIAGAGFALDVLGAGAAVATAGKLGLKAGATGVRAGGTAAGFSAGAFSGTYLGTKAGNVFGSAAQTGRNLVARGKASSNYAAKGLAFVAGGVAGGGRGVGRGLGNVTRVSPGFRAGQAVASTLRSPAAQRTAREQAVQTYRKLSREAELRKTGLARATSATGAVLNEINQGPRPVKDPPPVKRPNTSETPPNE